MAAVYQGGPPPLPRAYGGDAAPTLPEMKALAQAMWDIAQSADAGFDGKLSGLIGKLQGLLEALPPGRISIGTEDRLIECCLRIVGVVAALTRPIVVDGREFVIPLNTRTAAQQVSGHARLVLNGLTGRRWTEEDCRNELTQRGVRDGELMPLAAQPSSPPDYEVHDFPVELHIKAFEHELELAALAGRRPVARGRGGRREVRWRCRCGARARRAGVAQLPSGSSRRFTGQGDS